MADIILFKGKVPASFTASKAFAINARRVPLRFSITVTSAPTTVQCYLEFSGDGDTWFRETAEEDQGSGVVNMPAVVRTLQAPDGDDLPVGTTNLSLQFVRDEQMVRVQLACAGTATVTLSTPYGQLDE